MNRRNAVKIRRRSRIAKSSQETEILVTREAIPASGPYCVLPPHFFERSSLAARDASVKRTLLTISTWAGRSVMQVERC